MFTLTSILIFAAFAQPAVLPGDGIRHRDFLYTGQLDDSIYMVRKGEIVWSDRVPGARGHIQDAVLLPSGNFLLSYMSGVKEITPEKKTIWIHEAPPKCEVETAKPIGRDKILFIQNCVSDVAQVFLANKTTAQTKLLFTIPVAKSDGMHLQTRRAVLTEAGTLLIARTDLNKVSEFDEHGRELWSASVARPWSVQRLPNGNTLVSSFDMFVRELDKKGATVWEFTPKDFPDYVMPKWCVATRLRNGNTLLANNTPVPAAGEEDRGPVQAIEVSPQKKIVWALRSWKNPALGPAWVIQYLDEPTSPKDPHFGSIR